MTMFNSYHMHANQYNYCTVYKEYLESCAFGYFIHVAGRQKTIAQNQLNAIHREYKINTHTVAFTNRPQYKVDQS